MICEAEKVAAIEAESPANPATPVGRDVAISISASFDEISAVVDLGVPLRRPARRQPSRDIEQQLADGELAKQALLNSAENVNYHEFRKELGLGE